MDTDLENQQYVPIQLKPVNPDEFFMLYEMLESITIPMVNKDNRRKFPRHRSVVFGLVKQRVSRIVDQSRFSKLYPEIHDEIFRIGNLLEFNFTSVQLNQNLVCPPHVDSNNIGNSILVGFGDYTGGNIVLNNKEYDINCLPIIFNGSKIEHYNTEITCGNKYSLVFYKFKL